jgi:NAD(P)-dependent dehydrogenase (short-subunit alcohol dehydrogenase family)
MLCRAKETSGDGAAPLDVAHDRAAFPLMRSQGSGKVATISSVCGLVGVESASIYCASKFAVAGWSEAPSLELAPFGIRFTVVEPGMFRTDFLDELAMPWIDVPVAQCAEFDARRRKLRSRLPC